MEARRRAAVVADLFGVPIDDVRLEPRRAVVADREYPIEHGVIVLLDQHHGDIAADVQRSFGKEWTSYGAILPEHERELGRYFDLVDLDGLRDQRLLDLGCGSGRWSVLLAPRAREIVLVDFSEAIFVARDNVRRAGHDNVVCFRADVTALPFRDGCADLAYALGVLHHLPIPCLDAVRGLGRLAPELLVFLYYALDNRPVYWRALLAGVTVARRALARVGDEPVRKAIAKLGARALYRPLIRAGDALERFGRGSSVPLWDGYHGMSDERIEQDVYDRFFTRIEQRVTREQIASLRDTFAHVEISPGLPYWHFVCRAR